MSVFKDTKDPKSSWISRNKNEPAEKPWGFEKSWSSFDGIHGKTLFIREGFRTSLKYHRMKSEVLTVRIGRVEVEYGDELTLDDPLGHPMQKSIMEQGDVLFVQSGSPYRIKALENSEIIEIGNNVNDKPVRVEDDYGRESDK